MDTIPVSMTVEPFHASTGPRSGERGVTRRESARRLTKTRFNGAALRRARSVDSTNKLSFTAQLASTGPRSGERGVVRAHVILCFRAEQLQRGRAPESAEWPIWRGGSLGEALLQRGRAPESAE